MQKTVWIARDKSYNLYRVSLSKPKWHEGDYDPGGYWSSDDELCLDVCADVLDKFLPAGARLKEGEGPKRVKLQLGQGE